jgi:hypothetical protein
MEDIVRRAEAAFALRLEAPEVVRKGGRSTVLRAFSLSGTTRGPVILKHYAEAHREHYLRESAGLRALSTVEGAQRFVPQLLAEDAKELLLLTRTIAERGSYSEQIFCDDANVAKRALVDTARCLGSFHGYARSAVHEFRSSVRDDASPGSLLRRNAEATLAFMRRALGENTRDGKMMNVGEEIHDQLLAVADSVDEPSVLCTLTVGDMAPSNILLGTHGPVFVDLEYCGVRNAFYDAMYWHCICPFPAAIADHMDLAYRDALQAAGVQLTPEQFDSTMHLFMSHRLFWTLSWNAEALLEHDRDIVEGVSARKMICAYLCEYVRFAGRLPRVSHPALLSGAVLLQSKLSRLWLDSDGTH